MRKRRVFVKGAYYHVTSRTNNRKKVFVKESNKTIMLISLKIAKRIFHFSLANFCIMPTHFHLLIKPNGDENLSVIMHWLKTFSAKWLNDENGTINHVWGNRYNASIVDTDESFQKIMEYIDNNPVKAGLVKSPAEWELSGAYYKKNNLKEVIDI